MWLNRKTTKSNLKLLFCAELQTVFINTLNKGAEEEE
jgi:hypothetical protein